MDSMRPRYYSRQGRPLTLMEWAQAFDNMTEEARRIALTQVWPGVTVSTVWIGLDHRIHGDGPPLIFESMVFGGHYDGKAERYATEAEAVEGHERMVRSMRTLNAWADPDGAGA
jgi:hypothetical protein